MRLGDLDELKKHAREVCEDNGIEVVPIMMVPVSAIDNAPTVEPEKAKESELIKAYTKGFDTGVETVKNERPRGKWMIDNWGMYHCNYCMKEKQQLFNNFCSFCGADMRGEE